MPDPLPTGWTSADGPGSQNRELTFQSFDDDGLPPDLPVPLEAPLEAWSVLVPLGVVLIAPWVLAHFIRRRATNASAGQKVNWMVWMNWINLGAWLYWISVVHPADVAELLGGLASSSYLVAVAAGVALWSLPPLIAVAACLVAMAPLLSSSPGSFLPLLKRHVVSQAAFLVPLGIFLVGSQVSSEEAGVESATVSMVAAYVAYRALAWYAWTLSYAEVHPIESGELFERVRMLARTAGVTVSRLGMLRTRVPQEANAFAMPGGQIVLTESLVNGLTPREVDAVIAHELGHHKAGHLKVNWSKILFWVYILGAGSFFCWLKARFNLPLWLMTLPILPLLFTVLQGLLSQKREFTADARAVEITGDPEGTIAALARLAQLSRVPTGDRGIVGSIMSHPSMEGRVLALARKNNVPDARALEILRNPDSAYAGAPPPAATQPLPAELPHSRAMVFTLRAKAALFEQLGWIRLLTPLAGAFLIAAGIAQFSDYPAVDGWTTLLLLAVAPILALQLAFEYFIGRRFERRMRRGIARNIPPPPGATFVGLHPGSGLRYTEGFSEWDFGFLTLEGDWLCYRGEKARFAISRREIRNIAVVCGRPAWFRQRRVEITHAAGVFTIARNSTFATLADVSRTARILRKWAAGAGGWTSGSWTSGGWPSGPAPEPAPALPSLAGMNSKRSTQVWIGLKTIVKVWLAAPVMMMAGWLSPVMLAMATLSAPLAVVLRLLPGIIWPIRQPREPVSQPPESVRQAPEKDSASAPGPLPQTASFNGGAGADHPPV